MESTDDIVSITVKTSREKHVVEVNLTFSVLQLKEKLVEKFSANVDQLCIIFAGRILKDTECLRACNIKNGQTLHLVIRNTQKTEVSSTSSSGGLTATTAASVSSSQTASTSGVYNINPNSTTAGVSSISSNPTFNDFQQNMQRELLQNPQMLQQIMDNPMVQNLMQSPEILQQLINSNPQMQQLMERNPELTHMLNNPEILRQTVQLARNPNMMQELIRQHDRAISNLEALPGGFSALQRVYRDIQEPLMDAAQSMHTGVTGAQSSTSGDNTSGVVSGTETRDPLPNPWAENSAPPRSNVSAPRSPMASNNTSGNAANANLASLFDRNSNSMLSQFMQNPQALNQFANTPHMQSMVQSMMDNPQFMQSVLNNYSSAMGSQSSTTEGTPPVNLGAYVNHLQNPQVRSALNNPETLEALQQVMTGLTTLQRTAPALFSVAAQVPAGDTTGQPARSASSADGPTQAAPTTAAAAGVTDTAASTTIQQQQTLPFSALVASLIHSMALGGGSTATESQPAAAPAGPQPFNAYVAPEVRFESQLNQLLGMGFTNVQANLRALLATRGDVNQAIEILLSSFSSSDNTR